ncbi:MAG: Gfo/Idh/MocA family protein, partial [Chloroflexota bacterium]
MIRAALVGYGSIAEHGHLPALLSFPQVQIVAVADISPARLARARLQLPDAQLFDSPSQLIESVEPDLLDICSPPNTHAQLIEAACGRSIPTIVSEKPLVLTEHQYERVASARAAAGNRVISVNNWMHSDL